MSPLPLHNQFMALMVRRTNSDVENGVSFIHLKENPNCKIRHGCNSNQWEAWANYFSEALITTDGEVCNHSGEWRKLFWGSGVSRKAEIEGQWRQTSKIQFPPKGIVTKCQRFRDQTQQLRVWSTNTSGDSAKRQSKVRKQTQTLKIL